MSTFSSIVGEVYIDRDPRVSDEVAYRKRSLLYWGPFQQWEAFVGRLNEVGKYNEFVPPKVASRIANVPGAVSRLKFAVAREYSPAIYITPVSDSLPDRRILHAVAQAFAGRANWGAHGPRFASEVSITTGAKAKAGVAQFKKGPQPTRGSLKVDNDALVLRLWWD